MINKIYVESTNGFVEQTTIPQVRCGTIVIVCLGQKIQ